MLGGLGDSAPERVMRAALEASALDAASGALDAGVAGRAIVLADRPLAEGLPAGVEVEMDAPGGTFQFGERLADAVRRHGIRRLVYAGAGSAPLFGVTEWRALGEAIEGETSRCVTNNRHSADLFAVTPADLLARLDPLPGADNAVPRRLAQECGVEVVELPRSVATQCNLDTPNDLVTLALCEIGGPRLSATLARTGLATERVATAARMFVDRTREVLVAGRVSAATWRHLETEAACRVRVLSEERGMQAAGTDADGSARSILGQWIALAGPERAFGELLPEVCDAAFIDLRPALVQLGLRPSRADRFAADLGDVAAIEEPRLRAIVAAAAASPVPVVLGGHSLVGACLPLLNQWAWDERDAGRA